MKIQVYLCPASSFVTRIPQLKQLAKESVGNHRCSISVHIDDSIRHDCCLVDGRSDSVAANQLKSIMHEYVESDGVLEPALIAC